MEEEPHNKPKRQKTTVNNRPPKQTKVSVSFGPKIRIPDIIKLTIRERVPAKSSRQTTNDEDSDLDPSGESFLDLDIPMDGEHDENIYGIAEKIVSDEKYSLESRMNRLKFLNVDINSYFEKLISETTVKPDLRMEASLNSLLNSLGL